MGCCSSGLIPDLDLMCEKTCAFKLRQRGSERIRRVRLTNEHEKGRDRAESVGGQDAERRSGRTDAAIKNRRGAPTWASKEAIGSRLPSIRPLAS